MSVKDVIKDDNGKLSFSRVSGFLLVITFIIGFLYVLFTEHKISDIPETYALFIAGLYGLNKFNKFKFNGVRNEKNT